jgi:hypothetical protein
MKASEVKQQMQMMRLKGGLRTYPTDLQQNPRCSFKIET